MKCSRTKCRNGVRARGLCHIHFQHAVDTGVFPSGLVSTGKARAHLEWLTDQGVSLAEITRMSGVCWNSLKYIRTKPAVFAMTEQKILQVQPTVSLRVAAESKVPACGTRRRLQALAAIGYTTKDLAGRLSLVPVTVWRYMNRSERVELFAAKAVDDLFRDLHMTPGPSVRARNHARRLGWVSSLAWDDIDDPAAVPDSGVHVHVSAPERIAELQELGIRDIDQIARRLGVRPKSVVRTLDRQNEREVA